MSASTQAPAKAAGAAPPGPPPRRRRRLAPTAIGYLLILPTVVVLVGVQGYPLVKLALLSVQDLTQRELFSGLPAPFIGLGNYATILSDPDFLLVVLRTVVFTAANVALTLVLATALALVMRAASRWCRLLLTVVLICVWAMPQVVSTLVFNWLFDYEFGVVNWLIGRLPGVDMNGHDWYANTISGFGVITLIVVWGAIPFVAITLYAGISQVPKELEEAARVDGANGRQIFLRVTYPILRPIYTIVTVLSVIWDFQVFNQVWVARGGRPEPQYQILGVYSFVRAFGVNEYSLGAAIAVITVLLLLVFTVFYIRQSLRRGEID
ncbi:carbohydrate ABC transporter permease [Actinocatenispora sera]|uniref:Sugar ABC transporter permease n=1 Tax=Actinocatenispora sera TaxID=390989 RepID=A0A810L7M5_9ACTN|nr:sugar ABC transporter permease [Actinocatenispora sera]BCJ31237.1 sugar ABC transporter permease [Actinocatenispora sera]